MMDGFLRQLKGMRYAYVFTTGIVLVVIGANLPSVAICGIGIAILVVTGVIYFLTHATPSREDAEQEREEYVRDLEDTVDGYGMSVREHRQDIEASADEYASRYEKADEREGKVRLGK